MDSTTKSYFENSGSQDRDLQYKAYNDILTVTAEEVNWAYEVC
jgi:hypothetical protein